METCITICKIRQPMGICYMAQETQTGALYQPRGVGWGDGREVQKAGDICIPVADSCCGLTISSSYNLSRQYVLLNKVFLRTTLDSKPQAAQIPRRL